MWFSEHHYSGKDSDDRDWPRLVVDAKLIQAGGSINFPSPNPEEEENEILDTFGMFERWTLAVDQWLHATAAPESQSLVIKSLKYHSNRPDEHPGSFHVGWMIYPLQAANVFGVFFYYHSD